jgi:Catalase
VLSTPEEPVSCIAPILNDQSNAVLGAHGIFTSYGDFSNITAASFLAGQGKQTPVFVRFSTVAGSRGSSDTARDVHGFATRFYTDEGNFGKWEEVDFEIKANCAVLLQTSLATTFLSSSSKMRSSSQT